MVFIKISSLLDLRKKNLKTEGIDKSKIKVFLNTFFKKNNIKLEIKERDISFIKGRLIIVTHSSILNYRIFFLKHKLIKEINSKITTTPLVEEVQLRT